MDAVERRLAYREHEGPALLEGDVGGAADQVVREAGRDRRQRLRAAGGDHHPAREERAARDRRGLVVLAVDGVRERLDLRVGVRGLVLDRDARPARDDQVGLDRQLAQPLEQPDAVDGARRAGDPDDEAQASRSSLEQLDQRSGATRRPRGGRARAPSQRSPFGRQRRSFSSICSCVERASRVAGGWSRAATSSPPSVSVARTRTPAGRGRRTTETRRARRRTRPRRRSSSRRASSARATSRGRRDCGGHPAGGLLSGERVVPSRGRRSPRRPGAELDLESRDVSTGLRARARGRARSATAPSWRPASGAARSAPAPTARRARRRGVRIAAVGVALREAAVGVGEPALRRGEPSGPISRRAARRAAGLVELHRLRTQRRKGARRLRRPWASALPAPAGARPSRRATAAAAPTGPTTAG